MVEMSILSNSTTIFNLPCNFLVYFEVTCLEQKGFELRDLGFTGNSSISTASYPGLVSVSVLSQNTSSKSDVVIQTCIPTTWEVEAGRS